MGDFGKDLEWNVRRLQITRYVLIPEGMLWVSAPLHIIFSFAFALQHLGYGVIKSLFRPKG